MIDETSPANLVDPVRTVCLCDVGAAGYVAATVVAPDGAEHLVLAERRAIGDHGARYDSACSDVTHEQLGPLPPVWRHRTVLAPLRCGRRTKAGKACRNHVVHPGDACGWHRTPAPTHDDRQATP